ncbi:hypothetical protein [Maribellus sp. YY47]|uniref:hypothetical protein n=1 Tax=Maribellus sp. YY47 TaxID=2929486 RepID=UPI0020005EF1|nr:hypothetical protein [Maribellus sp. YY47]MCK3683037.1 hypothetical protein [Maribellus sp. YY47]
MDCEGGHKISPERAVKLLKEDGIDVTIEQAEVILDFMYGMAEIVVEQFLDTPG